MTDNLVERVAQALDPGAWAGEYMEPGEPITSDLRICREKSRDNARVAIEAMREPTVRMLTAADKTFSHHPSLKRKRVPSKEKHKLRYQAMIDEALEE